MLRPRSPGQPDAHNFSAEDSEPPRELRSKRIDQPEITSDKAPKRRHHTFMDSVPPLNGYEQCMKAKGFHWDGYKWAR